MAFERIPSLTEPKMESFRMVLDDGLGIRPSRAQPGAKDISDLQPEKNGQWFFGKK